MQEIRTKLNDSREKFKDLVVCFGENPLHCVSYCIQCLYSVQKQKQALRSQFENATKMRDAARDATRELKSMIRFKNEEEIDEEISKLEDEIQHSSLSLNEEKRVVDDIRQLKNSKSIVSEFSAKMEQLSADETTCKEINNAIKSIDVEITKVRQEEDELRAAMNAERKKEEASGNDNQSLWSEKEKCKDACKDAYEKIKDLRAAFDQEWQEFKAKDKVWRAQQAAEKARKREEYLKEKAAREAERAAREAEMRPDPFTEEIIMCDQLAVYLGKFTDGGSKNASDSSGANATEPAALDGMKVLKKEGEDPDAWMMGTGKKKGKGKKSGAKPVSSEKLIHSVDILSAFASLKVSVPITKNDVPDILKQVNEKRESFVQKQAAAKEGKDVSSNAEEPEESTASGSTSGKKAPKKKTMAPPKLDDESSWPSMGAQPTPVEATNEAAAAAEEEELEEGEVVPTPKSGNIAVSLTVAADSPDPVSVSISHE
jgi:uncharacterized coiled-coil DUF342 family protein